MTDNIRAIPTKSLDAEQSNQARRKKRYAKMLVCIQDALSEGHSVEAARVIALYECGERDRQ